MPRRKLVFDPRLLIGLLLVAASVAGVIAIVSAADESVEVYAAREPLAPGDRIGSDDLVSASVRLDDAAHLYLVPGDIPAAGVVVTRPVGAGELLPASSVGSVDGLRLTSVVLTVSGQLAESVLPGATVDVWAAREGEGGVFAAPTVIVPGATVVRLVEEESLVASGGTVAVELLVPKTKVARVLEAVANADALSIVPVSLPGRN